MFTENVNEVFEDRETVLFARDVKLEVLTFDALGNENPVQKSKLL